MRWLIETVQLLYRSARSYFANPIISSQDASSVLAEAFEGLEDMVEQDMQWFDRQQLKKEEDVKQAMQELEYLRGKQNFYLH